MGLSVKGLESFMSISQVRGLISLVVQPGEEITRDNLTSGRIRKHAHFFGNSDPDHVECPFTLHEKVGVNPPRPSVCPVRLGPGRTQDLLNKTVTGIQWGPAPWRTGAKKRMGPIWRQRGSPHPVTMMKKISVAVVCMAFALTTLGVAHAQIAAPTLVPGFVTDNPAAIQWGKTSQIGWGHIEGESEKRDSAAVPSTVTEGDSSGDLVGLRLVGEFLSFAAHAAKLEATEGTDITIDYQFASAALAIPIGDIIALGIGQEQGTFELKFSGGIDANLEAESSTPLAGISLRLGDLLYLGAAIGTETLTVKQTTTPIIPGLNFEAEFERDVKRYGIALLNGDGVKWHLGAGASTKDSAEDSTTGFTIESSDETYGVLEVNAGGFLLGVRAKSLEETDESAIPTVSKNEETTRELNVGWVPETGWSLVFIASDMEVKEGTEVKDETTYAGLLSFLF